MYERGQTGLTDARMDAAAVWTVMRREGPCVHVGVGVLHHDSGRVRECLFCFDLRTRAQKALGNLAASQEELLGIAWPRKSS